MKTQQDQVYLEIIPDAVLLIDGFGEVKGSNRPARRLFGYTKPRLSTLCLDKLLAKDPPFSDPLTPQDLLSSTTSPWLAYARHKDGHSFNVCLHCRKIEDANGALIAVFLSQPTLASKQDALSVELQKELSLKIQSEHDLRKQIETMREVVRILISSLDPKVVLELILDHLERVVKYDSASIMLLSGENLSIVAQRKLHVPDLLTIAFNVNRHFHLKEVVESGLPLIIPDTNLDPRWEILSHSNDVRCWLGVPLIGKEQVIGLLNLDRNQPWCFTQEDAESAAAFANHAAIAIENARLYAAERQRALQLDALHATLADISAELELSKLLQAILERATHLLDATGGDLGLFDEAKQEIQIVVSHNMGKDYKGTRMTLGEGAMGLAILKHHPVIVDEYTKWENSSPQYREKMYHAVLAVPFIIGRKVVGAIGIVDSRPERRFSDSDQYLLTLFAQHAAIAVDNANLYLDARQAAERRAILHRVSQEIVAANLDPEEIYAAVHRAAAQLMSAEAFVIVLYDDDHQAFNAVYLIDRRGRFPAQTVPANRGLSARILESGHSVYIEDTSDASQLGDVVHFGDPQPVRSVLAVPMHLRGRVRGMISAQSYEPGAYSLEDQNLLEMLASYAAIALDNAALFKSIEHLAATDSLTGIYNRRRLFELGRIEFHRARRFRRPLSILMIDIDHFKLVNDTFGHSIGDIVLSQFAQLLKSRIRDIDILGRYGGEEFVIILPETQISTASTIADRLRSQIVDTFQDMYHSSISLTASIGVASMKDDTHSFTRLIEKVDNALYGAKNLGRNRVMVCED